MILTTRTTMPAVPNKSTVDTEGPVVSRKNIRVSGAGFISCLDKGRSSVFDSFLFDLFGIMNIAITKRIFLIISAI